MADRHDSDAERKASNDKIEAEIRAMREEARRRHQAREAAHPSHSSPRSAEAKSSPSSRSVSSPQPDRPASSSSSSSSSIFRSALRDSIASVSPRDAHPRMASSSSSAVSASPDYGARIQQMQSDEEYARRLLEAEQLEAAHRMRHRRQEREREEHDRDLEEAQLRAAILASLGDEAVSSARSSLSFDGGDRGGGRDAPDAARQRLAFDNSGLDDDFDVDMSPRASDLERRQRRDSSEVRANNRRSAVPIDLTADSPVASFREREWSSRSPSAASAAALRQRELENQRELQRVIDAADREERERDRQRELQRVIDAADREERERDHQRRHMLDSLDRERRHQGSPQDSTDDDEELARRLQRELWEGGGGDGERKAAPPFESPLAAARGDRLSAEERLAAMHESMARRRIAFQRGGLSFSMDYFPSPSSSSHERRHSPSFRSPELSRPGHLDLMHLMHGRHALSSPVSPHPRVFVRGFPGGGAMNLDSMGYEDLLALSERIGHVNRGADRETISHLPTRTISKKDIGGAEEGKSKDGGDGGSNSCAICMEEFAEGDEVRSLPCFHMFHKDEIDKWLQMNKECPVCKHKIDDAGSVPQS